MVLVDFFFFLTGGFSGLKKKTGGFSGFSGFKNKQVVLVVLVDFKNTGGFSGFSGF